VEYQSPKPTAIVRVSNGKKTIGKMSNEIVENGCVMVCLFRLQEVLDE
jgi:hypothetical protein